MPSLTGKSVLEFAGSFRSRDPFIWVAVKEFRLSFYIGETLLFTTYTQDGNLISVPEQQPSHCGCRACAARSKVIVGVEAHYRTFCPNWESGKAKARARAFEDLLFRIRVHSYWN